MELRVNDYVRTKNGIITKIIGNRKNPYGEETIFKLDKEIFIYDLELSDMYLITNPFAEETTNEIDTHFGDEKIIKKSSPNIIDLIELRDIVELYEESWFDNGVEKEDTGYYEVLAYTTDRKEIGVRNKDGEIDWYPAENLRGIITYEQIESMEYKINEK